MRLPMFTAEPREASALQIVWIVESRASQREHRRLTVDEIVARPVKGMQGDVPKALYLCPTPCLCQCLCLCLGTYMYLCGSLLLTSDSHTQSFHPFSSTFATTSPLTIQRLMTCMPTDTN